MYFKDHACYCMIHAHHLLRTQYLSGSFCCTVYCLCAGTLLVSSGRHGCSIPLPVSRGEVYTVPNGSSGAEGSRPIRRGHLEWHSRRRDAPGAVVIHPARRSRLTHMSNTLHCTVLLPRLYGAAVTSNFVRASWPNFSESAVVSWSGVACGEAC